MAGRGPGLPARCHLLSAPPRSPPGSQRGSGTLGPAEGASADAAQPSPVSSPGPGNGPAAAAAAAAARPPSRSSGVQPWAGPGRGGPVAAEAEEWECLCGAPTAAALAGEAAVSSRKPEARGDPWRPGLCSVGSRTPGETKLGGPRGGPALPGCGLSWMHS